ncbi:MAG: CoA protein activase, partial [Candidatus Aminicenantes bacterium]|nr:CoA protein activase [Candidatus Aminicenantes bacterium]
CHEIGGHGQINVAAAVDFARNGFDAVLHFFPFTCLPEIIAKTVFVRIAEELDIPILSISIDEQTGQAGMQTRLEALIELAWSKKKKKQATSERFLSSVQQA